MSPLPADARANDAAGVDTSAQAGSEPEDFNAQTAVTDAQTDAVDAAPPSPDAESAPEAAVLPTIPVGDDAPPPVVAAADANSRCLVAEFIVTAQKRDDNLQNVQISISAFSGAELEARGVQSVEHTYELPLLMRL